MVSCVVIAKNEEKNIVDCLESLSFCNEIVVIDDNSTDRTAEIARNMGARVYNRSLGNNFSEQRNFGLQKATNEWVLFVDADETVPQELATEIISFVSGPGDYSGALIKRKDFMWGRVLKYGETGNIKIMRLGRKSKGKWFYPVHEVWQIDGKIKTLKNYLNHYPHQTIDQFLKEINYYTDIRSEELYKRGIKINWYDLIIYPKVKFFNNYILKLGFLDGLAGLIFAMMMSFHSFLVRGKLWRLYQNK